MIMFLKFLRHLKYKSFSIVYNNNAGQHSVIQMIKEKQ